ncbi:tail protein X [Pseudomonas straminea]|uniref:P2-like prophage tail protein X n=1 Tax=Pseudomonas straminea TaxID=47882 RepID=A0A1I1WAR8_PSEOC|nr:tail protein X [Pseudomonas straminea]GLX14730.1 tail protein X [Pseudomonas straminea]SFD92214.1 P2-like prophage tail protein X [Pseudomonas straminea]
MATLRANQNETLDALCWRHYGRTAGVVEAVLEANPGLADLGPNLPQGHTVTLPESAPQPEQQAVTLWD